MNAREVVAALRSGEHPTIDKPTVPEVLPIVKWYYQIPQRGTGGAIHIITDDGNTKRDHAAWCLDHALTNDYRDTDCDVFIAWLMVMCSPTQRGKIGNLVRSLPWDQPYAEAEFWSSADAFMGSREAGSTIPARG